MPNIGGTPGFNNSLPVEQIKSMKAQGLDSNQIIQSLQRDGFNSTQIFEAMNQAEIVSAGPNEGHLKSVLHI